MEDSTAADPCCNNRRRCSVAVATAGGHDVHLIDATTAVGR